MTAVCTHRSSGRNAKTNQYGLGRTKKTLVTIINCNTEVHRLRVKSSDGNMPASSVRGGEKNKHSIVENPFGEKFLRSSPGRGG